MNAYSMLLNELVGKIDVMLFWAFDHMEMGLNLGWQISITTHDFYKNKTAKTRSSAYRTITMII